MSADDDLEDVRNRREALDRADRFLSGSGPGATEPGWAEVAPILDAARQPATAEELVGAEDTIAAFTAALPDIRPRAGSGNRHVLGKVLTGKAVAGLTAVSLLAAGTAAAASTHFRTTGHDSTTMAAGSVELDDGPGATSTTLAIAESDPTTTTSTTTVLPTTTAAVSSDDTDDSQERGVGPDPNGPAKHGLCTAFLVSADHNGKNLDAPPWRNLVQAAADAGQTVEAFCADAVDSTSSTEASDGDGHDAEDHADDESDDHEDDGHHGGDPDHGDVTGSSAPGSGRDGGHGRGRDH